MKKLLFVLLSVLVIFTAVIIEGGNVLVLFVPTSMFMLFFGVLFSTLFTYKFSEIAAAFGNAFSGKTVEQCDYNTSLKVVKNMSRLTIYWSLTTVILGLIFILSTLSTPEHLGKAVAVVCLALLYGFGSIAIIFIPMENSLQRKIDSK